ncbi:MAG: endolytic transglycosylase MltG [Gammaproteobacteria bacterium]
MLIKKSYRVLLWSVISLFSLLILIYSYSWYHFLSTPIIPEEQELDYVVKPGSSLSDIIYYLQNHGYPIDARKMILLARLNGTLNHIQAGEYLFHGGTTPRQLLRQLSLGIVIQHQIKFIEGWSFKEVLSKIEQNPLLKHDINYTNFQTVMNTLGLKEQNPEGLFFPSTYFYVLNMSDKELLLSAYETMQRKLKAAWLSRDRGLPYKNEYEVLIVASMIEKETAVDDERPIVARVILNRLKQNMYLQIDPTVIYGLGDKYVGTITKNDLHMDTPYNTYRHKGLPPTPIALPSLASIKAAVHPADGDMIYYVATGKGGHHFSATWHEHEQAVHAYHTYVSEMLSRQHLPLDPNRLSEHSKKDLICSYLPEVC